MEEKPLPEVARLPWRAGMLWWEQAFEILNGAKSKWFAIGWLFLIFSLTESRIKELVQGKIGEVVGWGLYLAPCFLLPFVMSLVAMVVWAQIYSSEINYRMWIEKAFLAHGRTLLAIGGIYCVIIFAWDAFSWWVWLLVSEKEEWLKRSFSIGLTFFEEAARVFFLLASMVVLFQHAAIKASLYRTWIGIKNNWSALIIAMFGICFCFVAIIKMHISLPRGEGVGVLEFFYSFWNNFVIFVVYPFFFSWGAIMFFVMYRGIFHSETSR
jgi:hypothetical protein